MYSYFIMIINNIYNKYIILLVCALTNCIAYCIYLINGMCITHAYGYSYYLTVFN